MMTTIGTICVLIGALIALLAGLGLLKFEDVFLRLHAASKSASLGVMLTLFGALLFFQDLNVAIKMLAVLVLVFLKIPVASQAIARAAYATNRAGACSNLVRDEWAQTRPQPQVNPPPQQTKAVP